MGKMGKELRESPDKMGHRRKSSLSFLEKRGRGQRHCIDVTAESRTANPRYIIEVTKAEAPPVSGEPLPQPQSFQTSSASGQSQTDLASSASVSGLGEWKSQLIFAEPLWMAAFDSCLLSLRKGSR